MRPHFTLCIAALLAIVATAQAGVGTEAKKASGARLLLAGGGPPSLYTWNSRPKHDESKSGDHLTWPPKSRRHKQWRNSDPKKSRVCDSTDRLK